MNKSFTLIEILIVIVVIGVLSAFVLVGMSSITSSANITNSQAFSSSIRNKLLLNLVAEWKFDELTTAINGTTVLNNWGANNGTFFSDDANDKLRTGADCVSGKCIYLDGTGDYVRITSIPYASIHGPSTVDLWFKTNSITNGQRIFSDNCIEWSIYLNNNSIYGVAYSSISGGAYSLNKWHHVVLSHEHPEGLTNTKLKIYVNGKKMNEGTYSITTQNGYYDFSLALGWDVATCGSGVYFNGFIDDVRIYKEGVSYSRVKERYYSGLQKLILKGLDQEEYIGRLDELKQFLISNE